MHDCNFKTTKCNQITIDIMDPVWTRKAGNQVNPFVYFPSCRHEISQTITRLLSCFQLVDKDLTTIAVVIY